MPDKSDRTTTDTDPFDTELRRIAEALVAEAPDELPALDVDPGGVVLPKWGRPRSRRPVLAAAGVAAAALILVVGAVAVINGSSPDSPGGQVVLADDAGLEEGPQRLFMGNVAEGWLELTRDDEVIRLELVGILALGVEPLPDGDHVVVGNYVVDDPPEGFNEFTDVTSGLAVVGADGEVEVERAIEESMLLGVTANEAILARQPNDDQDDPVGPIEILTHDLATGEEHLVHRAATLDPNRWRSDRSAIVAGDLVTVEASWREETMEDDPDAGRIVPGSEECNLRVTDLASGDQTEQPLRLDCTMVLGMQASPDGSRLAVAYEGVFVRDLPEVRLAVVDLPSGAIRDDRLIGHNLDCSDDPDRCPPGYQPAGYRGMAWDDNSTLRLATSEPGDPEDEVDVELITVP